ncbi:class GN sortase [Aestuariicella hydrocarbonica]|uniref:Class GN sortase n=1 Tax=Pseudomaricurvus hydrocarbonicus TaxID=1470433 RepID=A0A9E5MML8_9GAMM|nr:class GN sortase [Aestuariicella hydrocarbonica]NHO67029.1 class GN sortase [Aestuariicella hydrocarbonica]
MTRHTHWRCRGSAAVLLLAALTFYGQAGYLYAKAVLAQWLIADAWQQSVLQHHRLPQSQRQQPRPPSQSTRPGPVRPWPWADTWPIARLRYQGEHGTQDLYILEGATGSSLAFGPGHMAGTAAPGTKGNSVVGGHRDTHFAFLQHLQPGDRVQIQTPKGIWQSFRVDHTQVHNIQDGPLWLDATRHQLQLITCYPFDAITANGPLRYRVLLTPVAPTSPGQLAAKQTAPNQKRPNATLFF